MTDRIQRQVFLVSRGTITSARNWAIKAFLSIRDQYYKWPSSEERKSLSDHFLKNHGFPNGFVLMDGTLLEFVFCPTSNDCSNYHGRKFQYLLTVLVINNDKREIIYYMSGFPGSAHAHNNRVWENTPVFQDPEKFFSDTEYILTDTAFSPSNHCIPSYKCVTGTQLPTNKEHFNNALSTLRVSSKHTIRIWKGRCRYLRKIRMRLSSDPSSLHNNLEVTDSTIILHKMLIQNKDTVDISTWLNKLDNDEFLNMDDAERVAEVTPLGQSVPLGAPKDTHQE